MSVGFIDRQQAIFDQVVALRRAERQAPRVREIPLVRAQLEQEMGSAVSLSMAARLLGVSEATVRRWVGSGDLPVVVNEAGRRSVAVVGLVDLYEQVQRQRDAGRSHVLEPGMLQARADAERVDVDVPRSGSDVHERSAARALAYHRTLTRKLTRSMVDDALHRVWEWERAGGIDARYARAWERLLRQPLPAIRDRLRADDGEMRDLRQNSPFAGVLSEAERRRILREVQ